ncbi:MAG: tRNA (guanosine(46)-N7)-methyltransferase TrmB [Prevotellaceae bacterium]|jgi:tRNA (guanine-N7-)-methyltransferase|nr:tRNA (guanosine(46)-N7)-methyltransferase TrmB [Prevotellaceae bacterium]
MGKNKWARFKENETFALLHQPVFKDLFGSDFALKGRWGKDFFKNENPIVVELGCGRGEYTVELAKRFPEKNFIGIDIKGARLWRGAKTATEENLRNVSFVRTKVDIVTSLFATGEVSEVWVTFPDPQPTKARKRLCSSLFLNRYAKFLAKNGTVHLKTDSQMLHEYTKALLAKNGLNYTFANNDIHANNASAGSVLEIQTTYEKIFVDRGFPITYLQFALPQNTALVEPDDFTFDMNVPKAKTQR